ncbi:sialin-like isoform X2 [Vanessa cardui]|uniref:sialin-like isoform X2 n=1 Tax=Vanessa cardui TaxID=171605 RepID=UPI001F12A8C9|nr:sialin-like isoform X2 [Vanessa cardui]
MEESKAIREESLISRERAERQKESSVISFLRSCCVIPQRYVFAIVGMIGLCNAFTMRVTLNMAITQMVKHRHYVKEHFDPDACPGDSIIFNKTAVINQHAMFEWDEKTQGLLLSGFYYGYSSTQLLGGYLAQNFGGKWVLGLGLLSTALFTFLTPFITRMGGSTSLFILRIIVGMGEGPTMPALSYMMAGWIPPHERAFLSAIIFGGGQIGNIFGSIVSGMLLANGRDWAYVFYFFGGFGLFWFTLWVGHDWGLFTIVTDLPKYTHDVLKFNIATTGFLTGLPFMAMTICAFGFGFICDFGIRKQWHSVKTARKIYTTIAAIGPAICIILASYSGCNRNAAMVYFIISMGLMGAYYSGMKVNTLDLAPNYAASLTSFIYTASTFAGIITPYLIGLLTPDSTLVQWRSAFWVCFGMLVGTNIVYCIWLEGEQIWWDDVRQFGYPPGWKHGTLISQEENTPQDVELIEKPLKDLS